MDKSYFIPPIAFHPGESLAEKLSEMDMSIKEFAQRTTLPEKIIDSVIQGECSLTLELAVAFESVTHIPVSYWLKKQLRYDEYKARTQPNTTLD